MFEQYKNRMAHRGSNMSEMLRMQSNMVIEQTWDRDPNYRRVYVVKTANGLPEVTDNHNLIDVKFNVDTYQKAGADEPAYYLQFRHGVEKLNSDIAIGSYVYMQDEDGEWKWWMLVGLDERPAFRQYHILECNWKFGWVIDGKIYYHLGVLRNGSSMREIDDNSHTSIVNGNSIVWMSTNVDTQLIGYNQRFLISDAGRMPPLCYSVANIIDTMPTGITRFVMSQTTFDPTHDNPELMLANYYDNPIKPDSDGRAIISYSGKNSNVKVGGSYKTFTPTFEAEDVKVEKWIISDEKGDIPADTTDYTIEYVEDKMKLKVAQKYNLIGTILTIKVVGTDKSTGELKIGVIG